MENTQLGQEAITVITLIKKLVICSSLKPPMSNEFHAHHSA